MDSELWRWFWTGLAVFLSIAEIFTAGFFLLPFGIGAAAAALLAWLGIGLLLQWLAFIVVSIVALVGLQRFIRRQDRTDLQDIGANRYLRRGAFVLETIDPLSGSGRVRVEAEEWRAVSDGQVIPAGTSVVVTGVRGSRLVVAEADQVERR
ncbi:MAG: NfeD family protein [Actinomycetota bacterium]|nr:NfeD family protein [Actinomycetota bacterium]